MEALVHRPNEVRARRPRSRVVELKSALAVTVECSAAFAITTSMESMCDLRATLARWVDPLARAPGIASTTGSDPEDRESGSHRRSQLVEDDGFAYRSVRSEGRVDLFVRTLEQLEGAVEQLEPMPHANARGAGQLLAQALGLGVGGLELLHQGVSACGQ